MIPATTFKNKRVGLFGLGGSGVATALSLIAGGADLIAWDDNPAQVKHAREHDIPTQNLADVAWDTLDALVIAPGVPLTHPQPHWCVELARQNSVEIIGDVEIFSREIQLSKTPIPFIAITGTNGKSTTTVLISHILEVAGYNVQMGGNIGTAVLTLSPPSPGVVYVVECSSYQIDLAPSLKPSCGILLNISSDHLDRHGTIENYAEIKSRLVAKSVEAVIATDDSFCREIAWKLGAGVEKVTLISKNKEMANGYYGLGHQVFFAQNDKHELIGDIGGILTLRGTHNMQNVLSAVAACKHIGVENGAIVDALTSFPGLHHRMQPVARAQNVLFVNDSKATNAEATMPALSSFDNVFWIAGGLAKEGGISSLKPLFPNLEKAYFIGEAAAGFAASLGKSVPYEISGDLSLAVKSAFDDALEYAKINGNAVVLFSPACASFDQFKNFEVRGDAFLNEIKKLNQVVLLQEKAEREV